MKYLIISALILVGILLSGCQAASQLGNELGRCLNACSSVCNATLEKNIDLGGYNTIGLTKHSGSMSVSCQCACG